MRSIIACDRYEWWKGTQKNKVGYDLPALCGYPDCQYTGDDSHAPVSILWNVEGVNVVADRHDIEVSKVYAERNTVRSYICLGRRTPYFRLRNGFEQWTI